MPLPASRPETHIVAHLVDYFNKGEHNPRGNQPTGDSLGGWGRAGDRERLWTAEETVRCGGKSTTRLESGGDREF